MISLPKQKPVWKLSLVVAVLLGLLFMQYSGPEEAKRQAEFEQYYRIYSLELPNNLLFAGEEVPMDDIDVKERYDRELLTNVYWQSQTILMIKRANRYFPLIEKVLKKYKVPSDFKYLAIAESGLQNVTSPAGASGYWQFLEKTGKRYDLEISEEVDERLNIERSTEAACKYFREAYREFGNWALVAASYNMGIEGVKRQMEMQRVKNYYDLYLNSETSRYVLRALAFKQVMEHPKHYGFNVMKAHMYPAIETYEITVDQSIPDLVQFAADHQVNYKVLKVFNPWLKKSTLSVAEGKVYNIQLPKDSLDAKDLPQDEILIDTVVVGQPPVAIPATPKDSASKKAKKKEIK
jgi:membrane-bound lytic murein transglycosylase D